MNYETELANINDIDSIIRLYSERMKWFKDNNIKQWSKYLNNHPRSEFEKAINSGNYYIIKQMADFTTLSNNDEGIKYFLEQNTKQNTYCKC